MLRRVVRRVTRRVTIHILPLQTYRDAQGCRFYIPQLYSSSVLLCAH
jgi:hypothetical protein